MSNNTQAINEINAVPKAEHDVLSSILVTVGDRVTSKVITRKSLDVVIQDIQTSPYLKRTIEALRALPTLEERQQYKKKTLPYFSFAEFSNGRRLNNAFLRTHHIVIDLDHIASGQMAELWEQLQNDPDVFLCFHSPSGEGLKVVMALDTAITNETAYRSVFSYCVNRIETRYNVTADADLDPARACFLSFDQELCVNPRSTKIVVNDAERGKAAPVKPAAKKKIRFEGTAAGDRTHTLTQIIGLHIKTGLDEGHTLELVRLWNTKNNPPHSDEKLEATVKDMFQRYVSRSKNLPYEMLEKGNSYYKIAGRGEGYAERILSNFVMTPKELLVLPDCDNLVVDIVTAGGFTYDSVHLDNTDWHSKSKLLKAIGHQDCSFYGSDSDVQALCAHVNTQVETRRAGTKVIGCIGDTWVTEGSNITASGISNEIKIVPFERGADAFYHKIAYQMLDDASYADLVAGFYANILALNEARTVMPILGWMFAAPLRMQIMEASGAFPILFVPGSQGSGKTSTASLFMRLLGYKDAKPFAVDMKPFPTLKLLSSTNAIPVFLDEFKVADMRVASAEDIYRFVRKSYNGEKESKGHADLTTEDFDLSAPICLLGEWSISQPAIKERVVLPRFTMAVKRTRLCNLHIRNSWSSHWRASCRATYSFALTRTRKQFSRVQEVLSNDISP